MGGNEQLSSYWAALKTATRNLEGSLEELRSNLHSVAEDVARKLQYLEDGQVYNSTLYDDVSARQAAALAYTEALGALCSVVESSTK